MNCAYPKTSAWCSCRPTHLSSTRSSGCGCICATIACPTAAFRRPRRSSTPVARLGTGCSLKLVVSVPYAPIRGSNRSALNQAGIIGSEPVPTLDRERHGVKIAPVGVEVLEVEEQAFVVDEMRPGMPGRDMELDQA